MRLFMYYARPVQRRIIVRVFQSRLRLHIAVQLHNNNSIRYEHNVHAYIVLPAVIPVYRVSLSFLSFPFVPTTSVYLLGNRTADRTRARRRCAHNRWPVLHGPKTDERTITSRRLCEIFSIFSNACTPVYGRWLPRFCMFVFCGKRGHTINRNSSFPSGMTNVKCRVIVVRLSLYVFYTNNAYTVPPSYN